MAEYRWTRRSSKESQIGLSLATQQKSVNFLDSWAIIATSSKATQKLHDHYWTSRKRPSYGTGGNHNTRHSKSSKRVCAPAPSSHNPTSTNPSSFKLTHWPMAWAPYSCKRVNTTQSPPKNPNYTQLHFIRQPSHPLNKTTTSTNENYWPL